jgi:tetratricopeptide (TPR) repeat protein
LSEQALELSPEAAIKVRGTLHGQLGNIYRDAGNIESALQHYQQCIQYFDEAGDPFSAAHARYNVALALRDVGRLDDAGTYAKAALANYQTFGEHAAADIQKTERLIANIDEALPKKRGSP